VNTPPSTPPARSISLSIIGLEEPQVLELCAAAGHGQVLVPANLNCPGQIVISGEAEACDRAERLAADFGARGAIRLKVAGAFHSPLMAPAADRLTEAMEAVEFRPPRWAVIANVDAQAHCCDEMIKRKLIAQVTAPVRWAESMKYMLDNAVESFYEIGPGRVLTGLLRRIDRRAPCRTISSADAVAKLAAEAVS